MFRYIFLAFILCVCITPVFATFDSLEKNCLFIENKYIDTCPQQWKQIKIINKALYDIRASEEELSLGKAEMIKKVTEMKTTLQQVDKKLFLSKQRTPQKTFFIQYMIHLIDLYKEELDQPWKLVGKVDTLFSKTYFDGNQEGIVITNISHQDPWKTIRQYDTNIPIAVTIRNFSDTPINNIEDIYCFATVGKEDSIFPLTIPTNVLDSNRIETINTQLITQDKTLLENTGQKTIHCTMVYKENETEYYTPYKTFTFDVEEA